MEDATNGLLLGVVAAIVVVTWLAFRYIAKKSHAEISTHHNERIAESDAHYVFTLIHGTWANSRLFRLLGMLSGTPQIQWYQKGSRFYDSLQNAFTGAELLPFEWSGGNSVSARKEAAEQLASEIHRRQKSFTKARHFIIAHSHGGNIACYALRDNPELQNKLMGVVCLSTPFLFIEKRELSKYLTNLLIAIPLFGLLTAYLIDPGLIELGSFDLLVMATLALTVAPLALISYATAVWVVRRLEKISLDTEKEVKLPLGFRIPFFLVRAAADEASTALTVCGVTGRLINGILALIIMPATLIKRLHNRKVFKWSLLSVLAVLIVYGARVVMDLFAFNDPVLNNAFNIAAGTGYKLLGVLTMIGLILPFVFPSILTLIVVAMSWGFILPIYGLSALAMSFILGPKIGLLAHVFLKVVPETAPSSGMDTISQFGFRGDFKGDFKDRIKVTLNHSLAYEAPKIIDTIVEWIRGEALKGV